MKKTAVAISTATAVSLLMGGVWWYCLKEWVAWHDFAVNFVQEDGRVIDYAAGDVSTSEGQAYALFFALVAGDRQRFEKLLRWTQDNLAQGDLHENLPAWKWGQGADGEWGIIDDNPASDADLWIAYSLLEAGRLWHREDYTRLASALIELVKKREVVNVPNAGPMLLPAPHGFTLEDGGWRFNPSYVPGFILARFAQHDPGGPWQEMRVTAHALLKQAAPLGLAPDWYKVTAEGRVVADPQTGFLGSYEAIRTYLWAGLWPEYASDPWTPLQGLFEMLKTNGQVPERIDTRTGEVENQAPVGFLGALLPYIDRLEDDAMEQALSARFVQETANLDPRDDYYDRVLILFGSGWFNGRYRIVEHGKTSPRWSWNCCEILH